MTVSEYLNQGRVLDRRISMHTRQISYFEEMKTNIASAWRTGERVQTSPTLEAGYAQVVEQIDTLTETLSREMTLMILLKRQIRSVIHQVRDDAWRMALEARYLSGASWGEVAVMLNKSEICVRGWNRRALATLTLPEDAINLTEALQSAPPDTPPGREGLPATFPLPAGR